MSAQTERDATVKFLTDPEFHARVMTAVALTEFTMKRSTGMQPTQEFRASFVQACCYGLLMAELPIDQMTMDHEQAETSMRAIAAQLGMSVGKQEL